MEKLDGMIIYIRLNKPTIAPIKAKSPKIASPKILTISKLVRKLIPAAEVFQKESLISFLRMLGNIYLF